MSETPNFEPVPPPLPPQKPPADSNKIVLWIIAGVGTLIALVLIIGFVVWLISWIEVKRQTDGLFDSLDDDYSYSDSDRAATAEAGGSVFKYVSEGTYRWRGSDRSGNEVKLVVRDNSVSDFDATLSWGSCTGDVISTLHSKASSYLIYTKVEYGRKCVDAGNDTWSLAFKGNPTFSVHVYRTEGEGANTNFLYKD
ncbi:hypothetical protein VX037_18660 [Gordonia sp. Z-3]|uniref:hypothetical protein n=1 Tax=Gordonia sp. Z-3 TaxID=3115408 RepID=UPI002E295FAA|nr:hypothetical protein [Gordonia sp. Z-3]MED5803050.1 hypothetical protein [Gordonia sp. Z-3]